MIIDAARKPMAIPAMPHMPLRPLAPPGGVIYLSIYQNTNHQHNDPTRVRRCKAVRAGHNKSVLCIRDLRCAKNAQTETWVAVPQRHISTVHVFERFPRRGLMNYQRVPVANKVSKPIKQ